MFNNIYINNMYGYLCICVYDSYICIHMSVHVCVLFSVRVYTGVCVGLYMFVFCFCYYPRGQFFVTMDWNLSLDLSRHFFLSFFLSLLLLLHGWDCVSNGEAKSSSGYCCCFHGVDHVVAILNI